MRIDTELKTGDILHCYGHGVISKLIRWFTKSWASHTAVVVEVWGQIYIVDAQKNGTNPKPIEAWLREYEYDVIVSRPTTGPKDTHAFSIRAFTKVGLTGYDFGSLFWKHPWSIITGKDLKRDPNDERMVCSEYVAWLYHIENPFRMTPKMMKEYCEREDFINFPLEYNLEINK